MILFCYDYCDLLFGFVDSVSRAGFCWLVVCLGCACWFVLTLLVNFRTPVDCVLVNFVLVCCVVF